MVHYVHHSLEVHSCCSDLHDFFKNQSDNYAIHQIPFFSQCHVPPSLMISPAYLHNYTVIQYNVHWFQNLVNLDATAIQNQHKLDIASAYHIICSPFHQLPKKQVEASFVLSHSSSCKLHVFIFVIYHTPHTGHPIKWKG